MTPERHAVIMRTWERVRPQALDMFQSTSPFYQAEVIPEGGYPIPRVMDWNIVPEMTRVEIITFVHEVEHFPGRGVRVTCEGAFVQQLRPLD